jgi:hypothetical protein
MMKKNAMIVLDSNLMIPIKKTDLLAAWSILENLAVSLDQMGGAYSDPTSTTGVEGESSGLRESLSAYFTPELVQAIGSARARLAEYVPEADAETLTDQIDYWDYATLTPGA